MMTDTKGGGRRTRIPNRIREIRQARGISMKALGDAVGVHFTTIGKIEKSQRGCATETLGDIARVLQVTTDELLGRITGPVSITTSTGGGIEDVGGRRPDGPRSLAASVMRNEVHDVADVVAMLPGLQDRDATLAAAIAFGLPGWIERTRVGYELGDRVAAALKAIDEAMDGANDTMYRITAARDAIAAVVLGASLAGPWSGDATIGMLEQAMALHPAQRDAYGLLIHMQRAAKRT